MWRAAVRWADRGLCIEPAPTTHREFPDAGAEGPAYALRVERRSEYEVWEGREFLIGQSWSVRLPGYVVVDCKRDVARISDLGTETAGELFESLSLAERLLERLVAPERVFFLKFGNEVPRLHFHVVPRTERLVRAYLADVRDDDPLNGAAIVQWVWSRSERLGHTDAEIAAFVAQARDLARRIGAADERSKRAARGRATRERER